jgi:hypothetical protein
VSSTATASASRPARAVLVEHRDLSRGDRVKPKPDAVRALQEVAASMRNMPRDCAVDRAELLLWLSRMARQVEAIALTGFEPSERPRAVPAPRQPFLGRPHADPRKIAEAVFGCRVSSARHATTTASRKGRAVKVEIRRSRLVAAGQTELSL